MRAFLVALIFNLASLCVCAQQSKQDVISPGGGYSRGSLYSLEWTLGETVATSYVSDREMYTQGFNQSFLLLGEWKHKERKDLINVLAAPNPVNTLLQISIEAVALSGYSVTLTDLHGIRVYQKYQSLNSKSHSIDMRRFANGVYLLQVFDKNNILINTTKVVKL